MLKEDEKGGRGEEKGHKRKKQNLVEYSQRVTPKKQDYKTCWELFQMLTMSLVYI